MTEGLELASPFVYCEVSDEKEEIFKDEVVDGIASCAQEQAAVWAQAAKEGMSRGIIESRVIVRMEVIRNKTII